MADNARVLKGIKKKKGVIYTALTPNLKGFQDAVGYERHFVIFLVGLTSSDDLDLWQVLLNQFLWILNNRSIDFSSYLVD